MKQKTLNKFQNSSRSFYLVLKKDKLNSNIMKCSSKQTMRSGSYDITHVHKMPSRWKCILIYFSRSIKKHYSYKDK